MYAKIRGEEEERTSEHTKFEKSSSSLNSE